MGDEYTRNVDVNRTAPTLWTRSSLRAILSWKYFYVMIFVILLPALNLKALHMSVREIPPNEISTNRLTPRLS